jgi:hypothetical protein
MAKLVGARVTPFVWTVLLVCATLAICGGCKKSSDDQTAGSTANETVVALSNAELNPDGSISQRGLDQLQAASGSKRVTVMFYRSGVSDAGMKQLAKYPNIRRVEAAGTKVTAKGAEELKKAIPEVEVTFK